MRTYKTATYKHTYEIEKIRNAFRATNFNRQPLEEILFQILEEFYWKAVKEQEGNARE